MITARIKKIKLHNSYIDPQTDVIEYTDESAHFHTQPCPLCNKEMGDMPGMHDAVCKNCGYKDPCCE